MPRLELRHASGVTKIHIESAALEASLAELEPWFEDRCVFVVTSPKVWSLHGAKMTQIESAASRWYVLDVPDGEPAKTLRVATSLWEKMVELRGHRDSRIVAFGGGSVGDVAGFVAACFLRGVEFIQIPTTLLAQVDAAIGGKTGVNLPTAKNCVGRFHHPKAVICDVDLLSSLSPRQLRSGLVEAIKIAALFDVDLLSQIENEFSEILAAEAAALIPLVAGAAGLKAMVVEADAEDNDTRRLLNFGHTLGHALEAAGNFDELNSDVLSHGEAVAYGMLFALRLAHPRGFDRAEAGRMQSLLHRLSLPELPRLDIDRLLRFIRVDKKAGESTQAWALPTRLGCGKMVTDIEESEIRTTLKSFLRDPWRAWDIRSR